MEPGIHIVAYTHSGSAVAANEIAAAALELNGFVAGVRDPSTEATPLPEDKEHPVRLRVTTFTLGLLVMVAQAGCGSDGMNDASSGDGQPAASDTQPATPPPATTSLDSDARRIVGTTVRFSSETTWVDVTIAEDNPAVRDFLSMLPMALTLEEFAGREKIGYPPRELRHGGSPGSDPESGDLFYYVPWGNLAFYYAAEGSYSDDVIHLGTYDASLDQLERLEGQVNVEVVD